MLVALGDEAVSIPPFANVKSLAPNVKRPPVSVKVPVTVLAPLNVTVLEALVLLIVKLTGPLVDGNSLPVVCVPTAVT